MKKIVSLLLVLLLVLSVTASALADAVLEGSKTFKRREPEIVINTNTYIAYNNGTYGLYDRDGNLLSERYSYAESEECYVEVLNDTEGLNSRGLISARTGELVVPMEYGDFSAVNEDWVMAVKLTPTTSTRASYYVSGHGDCNVSSVDVIYKGKIVATLAPHEYNTSSVYHYAYGAYCGVMSDWQHIVWIDSEGNCISVTSDHVDTEEFTTVYNRGVFHNPTQQYAFNSACTLKASEVEQSIWYNSLGNFVDLQGNVISEGPLPYMEYDSCTYNGGDYIIVRSDWKYGVVNLQGEEILPANYSEIGDYDNTQSIFALGYQVVIDAEGHLSYVDINGEDVISVPFTVDSFDCKGFNYNAPILWVKNLGGCTIITATAGVLEGTYEDATYVTSPTQRIVSVKKNGLWGCIDMSGNVVVPFEHKYSLKISSDGTLASGTLNNGDYVIYTISYTDSTAASTTTPTPTPTVAPTPVPTATPTATPTSSPTISALQDGEWQCECGAVNDSKFCPECGAAKPVDVIRCDGCGYEPQGAVPNFCPECGRKF